MRFDNTEAVAAWVEAARQGDGDAFAKLWLRFTPLLQRIASRHVPEDDIPDVLQNTAMKTWKMLPRFDNSGGKGNLRGWLCTIAGNEARNYLRHKTVKGVPESQRLPWESGPRDDGPSHWQDYLEARRTDGRQQFSVEERVSAKDLARKAVHLLPESLRRTFALSALGEYQCKEIAAELDCPLNTVLARLHRARNVLSRQLEPSF